MKELILQLQSYLREKGLERLREEFNIKARYGIEFPELVNLNYDQIKTPYGEKLTWACRGIIFNMNNWDIVSAPMVNNMQLLSIGKQLKSMRSLMVLSVLYITIKDNGEFNHEELLKAKDKLMVYLL